MHIRDLKPKENPDPPKVGEAQFGPTEHLCEECGRRWAKLRWNGKAWACGECVIPGQKDLPF